MNHVATRLLASLLITLSASGLGAQVSTTTVPVAAFAMGAGGTVWVTDVALRNDLPVTVDVFLTLMNAPGEPFLSITLDPNQQVYFQDVIRTTFGLPYAMGPILVQTVAQQSVTVGAATYAIFGGRKTAPLYLTPRYGNPGGGVTALTGLVVSRYYRSNLGLGNISEESIPCTIALQRTGRNLAITSLQLRPRSLVQGSLRDFFPLLTDADGLTVLVECAAPEAYAYGVILDNETQDAWLLP